MSNITHLKFSEDSLKSVNLDIQLSLASLEEQDLAALVELENSLNHSPWSKENFLSSFKSGHLCVGIFSEKKLLAYCVCSVIQDEAELLILGVHPGYQKNGLASCLLSATLEGLDVQRCFLEVRESNENAVALYEKLGFNNIGRRRDYYPASSQKKSKREDAIIFAKEFIDISEFNQEKER